MFSSNFSIGLILILVGVLFILASKQATILKYTGLSLVNLIGGVGFLGLSLYFATEELQSNVAKYALVGVVILVELAYFAVIYKRHKVVVNPIITQMSADMVQFTKWLLIVLGIILTLLGLLFVSG